MSHENLSDEIKRRVLQKFESIAYGIALETGLPAEYAWADDVVPKTWWERGICKTEEGEEGMSERYHNRNTAERCGVELGRFCNIKTNPDKNVYRTKTGIVKEEMGVETANKGQFGSCCTIAAENEDDYRGKSRAIESMEMTAARGEKIIEQELHDELVYSDDDDDDGDPFPVLLLEEKGKNSCRLAPSPIPVQCSETSEQEEVVTPWFEPLEQLPLYVSEEYLDSEDESWSQGATEVSATGHGSTEQPPLPPPELSLEEELQWVKHALCSRILMLKSHQ